MEAQRSKIFFKGGDNIILFCTNVTFHFTLLSTKKISLCTLYFLHLRAVSLTHKNPQRC